MRHTGLPLDGQHPGISISRIIAIVLVVLGLTASNASALTTEALLEELQHTAFDYFWNEANPSNGLVKDRSTPGSPASIAAVGFGLTAITIAIDHGWVSRGDGQDRVLTTLETFWNGPQGTAISGMMGYKGLFYHFLDMNSGERVWNSELSTIDTALLMAGVLDAKQYFDTGDAVDIQIRDLADSLYQRVDWDFMRANGVGIRMGWDPVSGFSSFGNWVGYNEAMILYILALGSPTHPVPASSWFTWTSGYNWSSQYGYEYLVFPPLFGHQYSHCWIDFRGIQDVYMRSKASTYFENSRKATLAAQAYCIDNPGGWLGYGEFSWGLTASDDPSGYLAHGAPPAQSDNGTITPTAAASSIPFAPEIVIPTLHYMYDTFGASLWSVYGFKDAFNLTQGWWATDYLGIDQGPIIIMIENYLSGSVWSRFMQNADVQRGLAAATFTTGTPVPEGTRLGVSPLVLNQNVPNPFAGPSMISYRLPEAGRVTLALYDVRGRQVRSIVNRFQPAGEHQILMDVGDLPGGVYFYTLQANGQRVDRRCVLMK